MTTLPAGVVAATCSTCGTAIFWVMLAGRPQPLEVVARGFGATVHQNTDGTWHHLPSTSPEPGGYRNHRRDCEYVGPVPRMEGSR